MDRRVPRIVMLLSNPYRPDPRVRREALALQEEGYDILLFAWDREIGHPRLETSEGIEIRRIGLSSSYDDLLQSVVKLPLLWLRMLVWLLREEFEVIHSHDLDTLPVGLLAARVKGKPCVFDAHEIYSAMVSESVPRWIFGLLRRVETILIARPDLLITGSERFGEIYSEMGARNVVVVMNSPPRAEIEGGNRESVRQSLGVEGKGVCLYAGMFERSRNLETIIRAFKTMEDEDP
ncbi:MAG: glycosyltransferase, partial [Thermoplasmata archaeon]